MADSKLKIGISPCPNDTFIFGHLIEGNISWNGPELQFDYLDIQALNEAVLDETSDYDLIKCSYAIFPKIKDRYDLFSVGAALGLGVGPLLVGKPGLPMSERKTVYVPGYDTTANQLYKRYGPQELDPKTLRYDLLIEELVRDETAMGVVIHESRFTYEQMGLELLLDLGAAWEADTKLPLPLGGPVISKKCSDKIREDLTIAIKDSLNLAWKDRGPIVSFMQNHAQEMDIDVMASHIDLYVNEYSLGLGSAGEAAIKKLVGLN